MTDFFCGIVHEEMRRLLLGCILVVATSAEQVLEVVEAFVRKGEQASYNATIDTREDTGNDVNQIHVHLTQTNIHNPAAIALGGQVVVNPPKEDLKESDTQHPPTEIQKLRCETERTFEKWTEGMVKTTAAKIVLDKISQGRTWMTITGSPGEGKTTAGYLVLKYLHSMGRQVYDIKTPEDYFRSKQSKQPILMFNDIFGSLHFDHQKLKKWEEVLIDMLAMKEHKKDEVDKAEERAPTSKLVVILISRRNVLNEVSRHLGRFRDLVLNEESIVDLTHGVHTDEEEKLKIWKSHSDKYRFDISEKIIKEVCQMSLPHGFPHCCRLFAAMYSKNKNLNMKLFFSKPLQFLNQTMESLMKDAISGPLLREMLRHDGAIDVDSITEDERRFQYLSVVEILRGTYLSQDGGNVTFHHSSIYDSAAFVVCRTDPMFVIKHCSLLFLNERVMFKGLACDAETESQSTVLTGSKYVSVFIDRLKIEFVDGNLSLALSHPSFHDEEFVCQFMKCILPSSQVKPLSDSVQNLIHTKDRTSLKSFLFLMTKSKSDKLLKYVCKHVALSQKDQMESLFGICEHPSAASMEYFLKQFDDININIRNVEFQTPLLLAAKKCSERILTLLLRTDVDISATDKRGNSALHNISRHGVDGDGEAVKMLSDKGADVNTGSFEFPFLPLHIACYEGHRNVVQALIDCGAHVNQRNQDGHTPLYFACSVRDKSIVILLLNRGADINMADGSGYPPLHMACFDGHLYVVTLLLERGAEINNTDCSGKTPLHAACYNGHFDLVKLLLDKGADINRTDSICNTSLHDGCYKGHVDVVVLLLDRGACINMMNTTGNTPLHRACDEGHVDVISLLIRRGADINKANRNGDTPLHRASDMGHLDVVALLTDKKASINKGNALGNTPLYKACDMRHVDVINHLVDKGTNIDHTNREGNTPFLHASSKGNITAMKCLLRTGADINKADTDGNTALHRASHDGHMDIISFLLESGAAVNQRNENGETSLFCAYKMDMAIMTLLLESGADINNKNIHGDGLLHKACDEGLMSVVPFLVEKGADMDQENNKENTPLHIACSRKNMDIVVLLVERGAAINKANCEGNTPLNILVNEFYLRTRHGYALKLLLEKGADINQANITGNTPLHRACCHEHVDVMHLLLERGAHVMKENSDGDTPLDLFLETCYQPCMDSETQVADVEELNSDRNTPTHFNLRCRTDVQFLNLLLEKGSHVNKVNRRGNAPLHIACSKGHVGAVTCLLDRGADIDQADSHGYMPFHVACHNGRIDVMDVLLDRGADVNKPNSRGSVALHEACSHNRVNVVKHLLDRGADINSETSVYIASCKGHLDILTILLDRGADINKASWLGETPVHGACRRGQLDALLVLLDRAADTNKKNILGETPLYEACKNERMDVVQIFLDRGEDVDKTDSANNTLLHRACGEGHAAAVTVLLDWGADINKIDSNGDTPLHKACWYGHLDSVIVLLDRNAYINKTELNGFTPLHKACVLGHVDVVKLLIDRGADVNKANNVGNTPLHAASFFGHVNLVALLTMNGADTYKRNNNGIKPFSDACPDKY